MKAIFIVSILCISSITFSQGLHVEENHSVLFGADTLGAGVKTMWIPEKAAFRTGAVGNVSVGLFNFTGANTWDTADLGEFSFASGYASTASGAGSTALGLLPKATGFGSIAFGNQTDASGLISTAMGSLTRASGNFSTALGQNTLASGIGATAIGDDTEASGEGALATGVNTVASGSYSTTFGNRSSAEGKYSLSMGYKTTARSRSEVVLGQYNTDYNANTNDWSLSDKLFVIGNGIDEDNPSDAMVVLKNGRTGIGSTNPDAPLEVLGEGSSAGGSGSKDVVALFRGYQSLNQVHSGSAISIDASQFGSSTIYLAEEGDARWSLYSSSTLGDGDFGISFVSNNYEQLNLDQFGNLTISGTYNPSSDINRKHNIVSIEENTILDKISTLPISSWSYKEEDIRHIGPMAQDFYAAFGLGQGETTIATVDADGVALAAIKALNKKVEDQEELIDGLLRRLEKLEKQ